jgi:hypothetical protein
MARAILRTFLILLALMAAGVMASGDVLADAPGEASPTVEVIEDLEPAAALAPALLAVPPRAPAASPAPRIARPAQQPASPPPVPPPER